MKINILVGARFQAKLLANFFQKNKRDNHIYTSSPASKWREESLEGEKKVIFIPLLFKILSKFLPIKLTRKKKEFDALFFDKLASYFMRDSDVLHAWATFGLYSARKWKKRNKYVIIERACPHVEYQNQLLTEEAEILGIEFVKSSDSFIKRAVDEYNIADKIIVPSIYSYSSFIDRGYPKEKLELIRLDANFIPQHIDSVKVDNTFVVGSVGGNVLRKGFLYLIDAWQSLKLENAKLLLKTSKKELELIPKIWNKIKDDDSIEIVGYLKDIEDFYRKCDVFCLPSVDDGFGMVVFEALACGKPVIATKNVGAGEMLIEGKTGFVVDNRDVVALSKSINELYNNKTLLISMSKNAKKFYEEYKNDFNNYENQMKELYSKIEININKGKE